MRSPIILESNLIPGNYGALPPNEYYTSPSSPTLEGAIENEDGTFTAKTYQLKSNTPTFDLDVMQNVYGTKYMPMFQWVSQQETGSVTFDPQDDMISEEEANELRQEFQEEYGIDPTEALKQEALAMGAQLAAGVGGQIGRSVASNIGDNQSFDLASLGEGISDFSENFKLTDTFGAPKSGPSAKVIYSPTSDNAKLVDAKQTIKANQPSFEDLANPKGAEVKAKNLENAKGAQATLLKGGNTGYFSGVGDRLSSFGSSSTAAGRANLYGSAGAGLGTTAAMLIGGASLKDSAKAGAKVSLGTYVGTAIGGPIGGFIGGMLGGRVICNELQRQGIMTRKQVVLDYRFTRDYLTPTHVNGYHIWAVWMVKQMRKGRLVNFWTHVAGHRANEIAYIYGDRDKPDYLGKVYRKILEPICWSIGFFCKKTDWSVLYKQKEV
jgi:hypothetical protein